MNYFKFFSRLRTERGAYVNVLLELNQFEIYCGFLPGGEEPVTALTNASRN